MRRPRKSSFGPTAVLVGGIGTLSSLVVPIVAGAPLPALQDVAVAVVLTAAATAVVRVPLVAGLLGASAALWSLTGLAGLFSDPVGSLLERVALLPHAGVVAVVVALPYGALPLPRLVMAAAGGAVAIMAGLGVEVPVLGLLAGVLATSALTRVPQARSAPVRASIAVELVLACGWLGAELGGELVAVRSLADAVDAILVCSGALVVLVIRQGVLPAQSTVDDELGRRVGAVLGLREVRVHFPVDGGYVDLTGLAATPDDGARGLADDRGRLVAVVSPGTSLPPHSERVLARQLGQLATLAELHHDSRRLARTLALSRRRLALAAEGERRRVEQLLSHSVLTRLNEVESLVADAGLTTDGLARTREEIAALVAGLDPLRGRTLGEALLSMRNRVSRVDAEPGLDAPGEVARAGWWVVAEAVANALKHAPDADIVVESRIAGGQLVVRVSDDGPGGADPLGRGLLGIADRAAVVGGSVEVRSDGSGTSVEGRVPLSGTWKPVSRTRPGPDPSVGDGLLASPV